MRAEPAEPLHLLRLGLSPADRAAGVLSHLSALGWRVRPVPRWLTRCGWAHSMTAPWGVVYLDAKTDAGPVDVRARVLAHEMQHARQLTAAGGRLARAWWALRYVLPFPWHRRRVEVEAEVWEAAMSAAMGHAAATARALRHHVHAGALGGWRWPHLTGGDPDELRADVAKLAAGLLARARAGGDDA